jgi:hypothetical protein
MHNIGMEFKNKIKFYLIIKFNLLINFSKKSTCLLKKHDLMFKNIFHDSSFDSR